MSEIKNGMLDQYGAEHSKRQQLRTAGIEGVKEKLHRAEISRYNMITGREQVSLQKITDVNEINGQSC